MKQGGFETGPVFSKGENTDSELQEKGKKKWHREL
ncbi:hypothetical protein CFREI_00900 [Corynebacterium freiburgense]|nr:hypothetical protein CFREI_00900 [Corynebacterium freiburgense]